MLFNYSEYTVKCWMIGVGQWWNVNFTDFVQIRAFAWEPTDSYFKYINQIWHIYFFESYIYVLNEDSAWVSSLFISIVACTIQKAFLLVALHFQCYIIVWPEFPYSWMRVFFAVIWTNRKPWIYLCAREHLMVNNKNCFIQPPRWKWLG